MSTLRIIVVVLAVVGALVVVSVGLAYWAFRSEASA